MYNNVPALSLSYTDTEHKVHFSFFYPPHLFSNNQNLILGHQPRTFKAQLYEVLVQVFLTVIQAEIFQSFIEPRVNYKLEFSILGHSWTWLQVSPLRDHTFPIHPIWLHSSTVEEYFFKHLCKSTSCMTFPPQKGRFISQDD